MSRVCHFTGKKTRAGRSIARRGKAKYLGGVGRKTTGTTKRKFKPNIQRVRAVVDGKVCRIKVSAKAIRMGLVIKPPKRNWKGHAAPSTADPASTEAIALPITEGSAAE
jgi:large subunit ribosomal protein L28